MECLRQPLMHQLMICTVMSGTLAELLFHWFFFLLVCLDSNSVNYLYTQHNCSGNLQCTTCAVIIYEQYISQKVVVLPWSFTAFINNSCSSFRFPLFPQKRKKLKFSQQIVTIVWSFTKSCRNKDLTGPNRVAHGWPRFQGWGPSYKEMYGDL